MSRRRKLLTLRWRAVRAKEGLQEARLYWQPKGGPYVACIRRGKRAITFETLDALESFLHEFEVEPGAWRLPLHIVPMEGNAS